MKASLSAAIHVSAKRKHSFTDDLETSALEMESESESTEWGGKSLKVMPAHPKYADPNSPCAVFRKITFSESMKPIGNPQKAAHTLVKIAGLADMLLHLQPGTESMAIVAGSTEGKRESDMGEFLAQRVVNLKKPTVTLVTYCQKFYPRSLRDLPARLSHSVFQWYKHFAGYAPASGNTNDPVETVPYGKRRGKELRSLTPALTLPFPPNSHEGRRLRREQFRKRYATDKADFKQHLAARKIQQARERILAGSSKPTLEQHLAAIPPATHTLITPKPILIDFDKHTPADLVRIFTPKFDGTLKRLDVFETLELDDLNSDRVRNLCRLIEQLTCIKRCLADVCNIVKYEEWRKWKLGCREIGDISFKGLRKNKARIVQALSAVYVNGYFDVVRFYENK
ncbi:uncharacterized protein PHACADRAFT_201260 [Phanerochaete carnosa HHB-10118-sp]|uniref:Uncharacterized protein n=1 Tax=Phanerochaete carnosa (strain HHB-10118-sp) TaxID=650164 RepID=K5VEG8_PHACS|nr:uncharacterized protein PHACADRAFT_201260 [Phanerochaete carnosa HHB-10118-sp]EKM49548.1 hypothetical protein PHACADRAFT_201260 [Phanerochaete carnosa HHB-10118-sp]